MLYTFVSLSKQLKHLAMKIEINKMYVNKFGCVILVTKVEASALCGVIIRPAAGYNDGPSYHEDFKTTGWELFTEPVTIQS